MVCYLKIQKKQVDDNIIGATDEVNNPDAIASLLEIFNLLTNCWNNIFSTSVVRFLTFYFLCMNLALFISSFIWFYYYFSK